MKVEDILEKFNAISIECGIKRKIASTDEISQGAALCQSLDFLNFLSILQYFNALSISKYLSFRFIMYPRINVMTAIKMAGITNAFAQRAGLNITSSGGTTASMYW